MTQPTNPAQAVELANQPAAGRLSSPADLRALTPARVALGRVAASLPTRALLDFTLDHARARDAVHVAFDAEAIATGVAGLGLAVSRVESRALSRRDYLSRPDLGRRLTPEAAARLAAESPTGADIVVVIGDGLSSKAVHAHAVAVLARLAAPFDAAGITYGPVVVATGARVALGDEIGAILKARMVVMLIGERPGLSAPDSLGAYLTFAPSIGRTDAERNCVSNIHRAGLDHGEAAAKIAWLVREGLARGLTGVALKDESRAIPRPLPAAGESVAKA
ncbi:MAG: ethanolamine ammonia-lyase subunit EutC [Bradyrhizobium sp.]